MSHRRSSAGAPSAGRFATDPNALHRCAVAFCSNPAVAEGVCEMHHSSGGRLPTGLQRPAAGVYSQPSSTSSPSAGYNYDVADRYRGNVAMQPPARVAKKQKTSALETSSRLGLPAMGASMQQMGRSPAKQYAPLTQASLNQMADNMRFSKGASMSAYDENPYLQGHRPSQDSTTGSVHSESDQSGDADRETNLRRERNRIAARKSRQRKLDRISNLEEEKMRLEQHRDMLVQEIRSLEKKDAGVASSAMMTITDKEYAQLQHVRTQIIKAVEEAYNSGDIFSTLKYFRDDSIVSGPQNSSVHLRGKDALVLDYLCTTYLFSDIHLQHVKVDSGGPRSQHFRVHWVFSGIVKSAGVSMNKEFLELIESVKGRRVKIDGVSNFSFSGDKIVYVHRTADQAKFLAALVNLSKE
ncbi:hypothetical protein P43SY_004831 [Pythium insidiosum]|uniref:BZIP domain-containing protein n=1 Tax=Pythium insidiosum TaxID=114742 RepID=A0AAD5Q8A2_PYTIN|nr:hypothetical protein P43SY_004831 [Pythium insidiosum]